MLCKVIFKTQLKHNISCSVVESYTKRYIVLNRNNLSFDSKQRLLKKLEKDNEYILNKLKKITDERLAIKIKNKDYDYYQIKELKSNIHEEVVKENMREIEERISKYFDEKTGLILYVHDRRI